LGRAGIGTVHNSVVHHPNGQHGPQEFQDLAIADAFFNRLHQLVVSNGLETRGDIRLDYPSASPPCLVNGDLEGIMRRALRSATEATRLEVSFEDRLNHRLHCCLHGAVTDCGVDSGRRSSEPGLGIQTGGPAVADSDDPEAPQPTRRGVG